MGRWKSEREKTKTEVDRCDTKRQEGDRNAEKTQKMRELVQGKLVALNPNRENAENETVVSAMNSLICAIREKAEDATVRL